MHESKSVRTSGVLTRRRAFRLRHLLDRRAVSHAGGGRGSGGHVRDCALADGTLPAGKCEVGGTGDLHTAISTACRRCCLALRMGAAGPGWHTHGWPHGRKQCHVCKRADIAGETHDAMAQGGRRTPSKAVEGWPSRSGLRTSHWSRSSRCAGRLEEASSAPPGRRHRQRMHDSCAYRGGEDSTECTRFTAKPPHIATMY